MGEVVLDGAAVRRAPPDGAAHPDVEAGVYDGGQERHPLLIGVE